MHARCCSADSRYICRGEGRRKKSPVADLLEHHVVVLLHGQLDHISQHVNISVCACRSYRYIQIASQLNGLKVLGGSELIPPLWPGMAKLSRRAAAAAAAPPRRRQPLPRAHSAPLSSPVSSSAAPRSRAAAARRRARARARRSVPRAAGAGPRGRRRGGGAARAAQLLLGATAGPTARKRCACCVASVAVLSSVPPYGTPTTLAFTPPQAGQRAALRARREDVLDDVHDAPG